MAGDVSAGKLGSLVVLALLFALEARFLHLRQDQVSSVPVGSFCVLFLISDSSSRSVISGRWQAVHTKRIRQQVECTLYPGIYTMVPVPFTVLTCEHETVRSIARVLTSGA